MLRFLRSKQSADSEKLSDDQLLSRFQQSPQAVNLTPLFERYLELTYGLCLRYLGTSTRAEDAVMDIFEWLVKKLPEQEIKNYRSWLQTVVRNHCLMQLRKEKRDSLQNSVEFDVQLHDMLHQEGEDDRQDVRETALQDCIDQLSQEQKQGIEMFYLQDGHTYKSIADHLDLDLGRVRSFIQNGRRNLRICLESKTERTNERE
ncbi:MAG: sigma-70 family RNA polymerase sigma factor [Bacteroidota bacterium]